MTELKELKEFPMKERLLNMMKWQLLIESQFKGPLPIIMLLKPKFNIFLKKSKKLLLNMNQLKELGKEFNISQLKPKLFTTQKEKNMLLEVMLTQEVLFLVAILPIPQEDTQLEDKHMFLGNQGMFLARLIQLEDLPSKLENKFLMLAVVQVHNMEQVQVPNMLQVPNMEQAQVPIMSQVDNMEPVQELNMLQVQVFNMETLEDNMSKQPNMFLEVPNTQQEEPPNMFKNHMFQEIVDTESLDFYIHCDYPIYYN